MWIKTKDGILVNADTFTCIAYDSENNITVGKNDHDYSVISDGNVIPQIITAIRQGDNYMGVN